MDALSRSDGGGTMRLATVAAVVAAVVAAGGFGLFPDGFAGNLAAEAVGLAAPRRWCPHGATAPQVQGFLSDEARGTRTPDAAPRSGVDDKAPNGPRFGA
jgi:hypothetical protein